ncbi:hypothetical protein FXV83_00265 [Bradyrhizobium hipponense]|uniref:Uncharacterized protein n=1 Tax=Bradyrhizobium hipponense TaxID=2605638 RepID=A0A5S4YY60_9BRAD|nr:hypothetical protein [Bradyrhizobium hipponense]TYO68549.1 hypothetical protein FXV83_00265 [Bradyrhizobium hipponense]
MTSFAVNRLWPIIYLTALLIFTFMFLGLGAASLMGFAMEFPRRLAEAHRMMSKNFVHLARHSE